MKSPLSQTLLQTAVAGLFSACAVAQTAPATQGASKDSKMPAPKAAKVMCVESNSCHGSGSCKSTSNKCKGQNSCGGHVYEAASEEACKAGGGTPKS